MEHGKSVCHNQARIYDPEGNYLGFYSKILNCSSLLNPGCGEMSDFAQGVPRVFEWKGVRFGTLICNDMWATPGCTTIPNPYLAWQLRRMGAGLIVHLVNSGNGHEYRAFHESTVERWSNALNIPIFAVNASGDGTPVNARSGLVHPNGIRPVIAPESGDQYFTCKIEVN
jgi:predicted amidohydrolase